MRRILFAALVCFALPVAAQRPPAFVLPEQPADPPAPAPLVPEGATVEKVADGYRFTEGPAAGPDGCIYFTDIPAQLILKYDPATGETVTFLENTGEANGLAFYEGRLHSCEHKNRRVASGVVDGEIIATTEASHYEGVPLNSPNDLAIDQAGTIYFTDPRYGNRDSMETEVEGVYWLGPYINDAMERPEPICIDADLTRPNGIVLSPDEPILYVADHGANWIYAYDIVEPGKVENKRQFAQLNNGEGRGSDGMCVDGRGRVYATGHNKVWVFEPSGELVTTIDTGPQTTNCTFAADGKTLYITADHGLFLIALNTDEPLSSEETE